MAKNNGGLVVNVSATDGITGGDQRIYGAAEINSNLAYAATKRGILDMTRWMASYWRQVIGPLIREKSRGSISTSLRTCSQE